MNEYLLPIAVITVLILINGLFVAAEFGIAAAPRTRIQQLAEDHPVTELWQVVAGISQGRESVKQITLFDSVGFAIEDFSTAISLSPESPEPYNGRGISYMALGDDENAFADFNLAIKLDDRKAESWANQALVYEKRGDMKKARASYSRAAALDPNYGPARAGLERTRGS